MVDLPASRYTFGEFEPPRPGGLVLPPGDVRPLNLDDGDRMEMESPGRHEWSFLNEESPSKGKRFCPSPVLSCTAWTDFPREGEGGAALPRLLRRLPEAERGAPDECDRDFGVVLSCQSSRVGSGDAAKPLAWMPGSCGPAEPELLARCSVALCSSGGGDRR